LAGTKLYCLVTEAHGCEQLAQSCYSVADWPGVELETFRSRGLVMDRSQSPAHESGTVCLLVAQWLGHWLMIKSSSAQYKRASENVESVKSHPVSTAIE